jgi:hypothetical protein
MITLPVNYENVLWRQDIVNPKSAIWLKTQQLVTYLISKDYAYFVDGKETSDVDYIVDSMIEGRMINCVVPE